MSMLVESLRRLYQKGSVTLSKIEQMRDEGKISEEDFEYITKE